MTPEFKYGLIIGLGISCWLLVEYALGLHTAHLAIDEYTSHFSLLVLFIALFFLLKNKRNSANLKFGPSIISGLTASFLAALIVYGFTLSYNQWINPEWIDDALALKVAAMRTHHVSEAEIRQAITAFRQANSTAGLVVHVIASLTVIGGIISVLLVVVMRAGSRSQAIR